MNKYYVYQHIMDGQIVYIGKGCGARAFQPRPHCEHLTDVCDFSYVHFVKTCLSEVEALRIEKEMIQTLRPRFNKTLFEYRNDYGIKNPGITKGMTDEEKKDFFRECGKRAKNPGRPRKIV